MNCVICGNEVTAENISNAGLPYLCFKCESEVVQEPIWNVLMVNGGNNEDRLA